MKNCDILGHVRSGYFGDADAVAKGKRVGNKAYGVLPNYSGKNSDLIMKITSNHETAMYVVKM